MGIEPCFLFFIFTPVAQILTHGHFHTFVACCCCNSLGKEKRRASHSAMVMIMGVQGSAVVANVVVARGAWRRQQTAMAASSFFSLQYLRNFLHCRRTNGQRKNDNNYNHRYLPAKMTRPQHHSLIRHSRRQCASVDKLRTHARGYELQR